MCEQEDPIDRLIRLVARAERLEALPRTGWLVCGIAQPESIAAHSYMVALIALWLADHVGQPVDVATMLRIALVHDLGESMLTDLPAPVKRFVGADMLQAAEERAAQLVLHDGGPPWQAAHAAYESRESLEARIVKAADRIQMLCKALQYEAQHRGDTRRFWAVEENFQDEGLPLVRTILDRLRTLHEQGGWPVASFD
jgi:putative hydrolase of HD superfamily